MTRFLPHWRKATWALAIFTALMGIWVVTGIAGVSNNCASEVGQALQACQAGTAIGGGIAVTFILIVWFIGFIVLGLVWLMSRPKESVVIRGPEGQQVTLSEKEAKRRIAKEAGWSYQPHGS
jgi:hypothetical protein